MCLLKKNPSAKREVLKKALQNGDLLQAPGAFSPMVAMEIEKSGFPLVYISGAVLAADLGLPDIGLTTMSEVAERGRQIARVTNLPCIIDADTGFGEPMNVARCVQLFEDAGLAGMHLEDQVHPKRCGHLDHKSLCSTSEMVKRIQTAAQARCDKNFLIIARTDARGVEGMEGALKRIEAYTKAGAEVIFPEAIKNAQEFEKIQNATSIPVLANMTEFGKSDLLDARQLAEIGIQIVIYPVTLWRLAIGASCAALKEIKNKGHQKDLIEKMQTRAELYETLNYKKYNQFDKNIFNFQLD
jgi:methylisocitrate lyase